jgi:hypothetical protein
VRAAFGPDHEFPLLKDCEMNPAPIALRLGSPRIPGKRSRRQLRPAVHALEGRQLLSGSSASVPAPTATMTQTATFPNLESFPDAATQAFLYFNSSMGTLTEVDLVTSGSYTTQFEAQNLGATSSEITGTTTGNVSINVPTGAIPVTIPAVTENFEAAPFAGTLEYGGTSGNDFAPVTSNSASQTTVLTSPADLSAFTGNFRIPITVSGHATGTATSTNGQLSDNFNTQTSVTLTVIYHYTPNPPSQDPAVTSTPSSPTPSNTGDAVATSTPSSTGDAVATSVPPATPGAIAQNATPVASGSVSLPQTAAIQTQPLTQAGKKKTNDAATRGHKNVRLPSSSHVRPTSFGHTRRGHGTF